MNTSPVAHTESVHGLLFCNSFDRYRNGGARLLLLLVVLLPEEAARSLRRNLPANGTQTFHIQFSPAAFQRHHACPARLRHRMEAKCWFELNLILINSSPGPCARYGSIPGQTEPGSWSCLQKLAAPSSSSASLLDSSFDSWYCTLHCTAPAVARPLRCFTPDEK